MSTTETAMHKEGSNGIGVMLVDDQAMIGEAFVACFSPRRTSSIDATPDPREAMAIAREWRPTVILQDLVMPEVDGLDLVRDYSRTIRRHSLPS